MKKPLFGKKLPAATAQDVADFDHDGFLRKLSRYALRLGRPVVIKLYTLYLILRADSTPMRSKLLIVGALLYFVSPIDAIPDLLLPFGFSDDIAVITLAYRLIREHLTDDIRHRAEQLSGTLLNKAK